MVMTTLKEAAQETAQFAPCAARLPYMHVATERHVNHEAGRDSSTTDSCQIAFGFSLFTDRDHLRQGYGRWWWGW